MIATGDDHFVTSASLRPAAVSEINGKVDYSGGSMNSSAGHNFNGSLTIPIASQFGFQADALYSRISGADFLGGAGHFFWRHPGIGLFGVTGGYLHRAGVDTFQAGAEGELYWRQFSFGFFGGLGSIEYRHAVPFMDTHPELFVGRVSASYYPVENLRVTASFTTAFRDSLAKGEVEYQTPLNGLALTGEVAQGSYGYDHLLFGVRYYFGGKKTLRERQRQDDPPSLTPQILHSLGLYGAEFNRQANTYLAAHPGSVMGGGGSYGSILYEATRTPGGGSEFPPIPPTPANPGGTLPPLPN